MDIELTDCLCLTMLVFNALIFILYSSFCVTMLLSIHEFISIFIDDVVEIYCQYGCAEFSNEMHLFYGIFMRLIYTCLLSYYFL